MPHRANRTFVSNSDALTAWMPIARERLLEAASSYHATVTEEDLATTVQVRSGIAADQPTEVWIGKLLERVARESERLEEPPLATLCIGPDDNPRRSSDRLTCYRAYADDVPADGGQPAPVIRATLPRRTITREPKPRVERKPATPANQMREVTCTSCFMIVAAERGECSSCGAKLTV
jgi:hypothetical protein